MCLYGIEIEHYEIFLQFFLLCYCRTNSTNVPHKWDLDPGQPHP